MLRIPTLVLAGLALTTTALAQSRPEPMAEVHGNVKVARVPIHTAAADPIGGDYGTWAGGADYKVEFQERGIRFVPYLGPTESTNREFGFELESVTVAGQPWRSVTRDPQPRHDSFRYEFDRDAIVEAYDVREHGLEQTFVITRRPERAGDLVLCGRVRGNVTARQHEADHRPIAFSDENGRAVLEYGVAFALRDSGAKQPIESSFDGERIRLRVPAAILEHSTYPLVIDPVIANVAIPSGSYAATTRALDIVVDEQNNRVFMTLIRRASSGDGDLFVIAMDQHFTGTATTVFADMATSWSTTEGSVSSATNPIKIVTALVRSYGNQDSAVAYNVRPGASLSFNGVVGFVPRPAGLYDFRVDIGGMRASGTHVMLVFERRDPTQLAIEGVTAAALDISGSTPVLGAPFPIRSAGFGTSFAFFRTSRPSITKHSRTASQPDSWLVAFQERQITGTSGVLDVDYIVARQVSVNGTHSTGYWTPSQTYPLTHHRRAPRLAGRPGAVDGYNQYGVAFIERPVSGGGFVSAFEGLTWPVGAQWPTASWGQSQLSPATGAAFDSWIGDVAADLKTRSHWLVSTTSGLHRVDRSGVELEFASFPPNVTNYFYPGGIDFMGAGQFVTLSCHAQAPFAFPGPVTGRVFENPTPPLRDWTGPTCGTANIEWTTQFGRNGARFDQQIGHDFTQVQVTGTPTGTLHFLLYSFGTQVLDLTGTGGVANGCWLLVQPTWNQLLVQNGTDARWNFPLPTALPNLTLHFQDWYLLPGNATLRSTERLNVPIAK
ncbi:MAG: hypothetical protein NXI31_10505 [bacterium]|nr:hypothetical protein [bacterium]